MTRREKVLLVILGIAAASAAFVLLFFMPMREEISVYGVSANRLESDLEMARIRTLTHQALSERLSELMQEIADLPEIEFDEDYLELPDNFCELAALNLIQRIMYDYTERISISWAPPVEIAPYSGLYVHRFEIAFEASYHNTISILEGFIDSYEDYMHRIVRFDMSVGIVEAPPALVFDEHPEANGDEDAEEDIAEDDAHNEEDEGVEEEFAQIETYLRFSVNMNVEFLVRPRAWRDSFDYNGMED